jgi:hypothetical protein
MFPLFTESSKKSWLMYRKVGQGISVGGALLALICVVAGFYQLAAILAGIDLIFTRFALGVMNKTMLGGLGSSR